MTDKIIKADIDRIVYFHVKQLFGCFGRETCIIARNYIIDHLQYEFDVNFLPQCTLSGGNWAQMFMSGIRYWFPEVYAAMPDRCYTIDQLLSIIMNCYLVAELKELIVRILFEELDWSIDEISCYTALYDWLFSDDNYSAIWM
jgi:hypothetical protein